MTTNLILMSINKVGNPMNIISEGTPRTIFNKFDELTDELEKQNIFMVNEKKLGTNSFIREFATKKDGWVFTLATAGDLVENSEVIENL